MPLQGYKAEITSVDSLRKSMHHKRPFGMQWWVDAVGRCHCQDGKARMSFVERFGFMLLSFVVVVIVVPLLLLLPLLLFAAVVFI